jgi:hypothetical protein
MPAVSSFVSVNRIIQQAECHPLEALPAGTHQSYPFPARGGRSGSQMIFFYCPAKILDPRAGLTLWPPTYVAYLSAANARFEELKAVAPGDFGQRHPADKPQIKWIQDYDIILPCFAAKAVGLSDEQRQAAREFSTLLPEIVESPLMPYFQAAAAEFFDWLKLMKSR